MSVDFPDPETPVMTVRTPMGIFTSIPLRLFSLQPESLMNRSLCRRAAGTSILRSPAR